MNQTKLLGLVLSITTIFFVFLVFGLLVTSKAMSMRDNAQEVVRHGELTLLTVTEVGGNLSGGVAKLLLDITPGKGMVYIDTYPLAKIDTIESVRFANTIACERSSVDCSQYDFFYTIKAGSAIVGGPSAGAGIAGLTLALLNGFTVKPDVAVTGTITSGAVIGPVSGLAEKASAARNAGINIVLVPRLSIDNETGLEKLEALSVRVIPVENLYQVLYYLTGVNITIQKELKIPDYYEKTMHDIALDICNYSASLVNITGSITGFQHIRVDNKNITAKEMLDKAFQAIANKDFYSAASLCYGVNVVVKAFMYNNTLSDEELLSKAKALRDLIGRFNGEIKTKEIKTLTDLQTFLVVRERLEEAANKLQYVINTLNSDNRDNKNRNASNNTKRIDTNTTPENISKNKTIPIGYGNNEYYRYKLFRDFATAEERYNTAVYWARFFNSPGIKFHTKNLKRLALRKILEAEERVHYLDLLVPRANNEALRILEDSKKRFEEEMYALALFKASKAEAQVNMVLSTIGLKKQVLNNLINAKLDSAKRLLSTQKDFPFLGYSYYEYSRFLQQSDPYSALLYAEYALELGNLENFMPSQKSELRLVFNKNIFIAFFVGLFSGFAICSFLIFLRTRNIKSKIKSYAKRNAKPKKSKKRVIARAARANKSRARSIRKSKPWRGSYRTSPGKKR